MSPSETVTLKNIFVEQYRICDIRSNFQHSFWVSGALSQTPPGALSLYEPHRWRSHGTLFCPLLRKRFLATPLSH